MAAFREEATSVAPQHLCAVSPIHWTTAVVVSLAAKHSLFSQRFQIPHPELTLPKAIWSCSGHPTSIHLAASRPPGSPRFQQPLQFLQQELPALRQGQSHPPEVGFFPFCSKKAHQLWGQLPFGMCSWLYVTLFGICMPVAPSVKFCYPHWKHRNTHTSFIMQRRHFV